MPPSWVDISKNSMRVIATTRSLPHASLFCFKFLAFLACSFLFAGLSFAGSISGVVLNDTTNEPAKGLRVELREDISGVEIPSVITNAQGIFTFQNLSAGEYSLGNYGNASYFPVNATAGDSGSAIQPADIIGIMLGANDDLVGYAFDVDLMNGLSSVRGSVYHDQNNNGIRESGEEGIPNVEILAESELGDLEQVFTDADGDYELVLLESFNWDVIETQPSGWFDGMEAAMVPSGSIGQDRYIGVLASGYRTGYNFGELDGPVIANPAITSPTPGSTLAGASDTFTWQSNGVNATDFWLYLGSAAGSADYFNSRNLNDSTSVTVYTLPSDGTSTVYARLWYRIDGTGPWLYVDQTYTAGSIGAAVPDITSHNALDPFSGAAETLDWTENGSGATQYWLYAGSVKGGVQYFSSGDLASSLNTTLIGLPTNGSSIWVRLWYRINSRGPWLYIDEEFTADGTGPSITSSTGTNVLLSPDDTFSWTEPNGTVTAWWLYAGSSAGRAQYENSGNLNDANTFTTTSGSLPIGSVSVYVRLWYQEGAGNEWQFVDREYTSAQ